MSIDANPYIDEDRNRDRVRDEGHRRVVGGMWDVIGPLQRDFLVARGLLPQHRVLDVGCGAMRAGGPLTRYLDPHRYYGIDISQALIEAGHAEEIVAQGLGERLPRAHLHVTGDYEVPFGVMFDVGLATSLFTHMPLSEYTRCMARLAPVFAPGAAFYATVFEGEGTTTHPRGIVSYPDRDPFGFSQAQMAQATPASWHFGWIGEWGHPRDQQMAVLTRV